MKLHFIDSLPGSGKTETIIKLMRGWRGCGAIFEAPNPLPIEHFKQIVYISPLLSETEQRIPEAMEDPDASPFMYPMRRGDTSKTDTIRELLRGGCNISATHALFRRLDESDVEFLKHDTNLLIIDEAMDVVEPYPVTKGDFTDMLEKGRITVDSTTGLINWVETSDRLLPSHSWYEFRNLALSGALYLYGKPGEKKAVVMFQYPPEVLKAFTTVIVMTYRFNESLMAKWAEANGFECEELVGVVDDSAAYEKRRELIRVVGAKDSDDVGFTQYAWDKAMAEHRQLKKPTTAQLKQDNITKVFATATSAVSNKMRPLMKEFGAQYPEVSGDKLDGSSMLVSCPKTVWEGTSPLTHKKLKDATWLDSGCKATNAYSDRWALFYMMDKRQQPVITQFMQQLGVELDEDEYALSALIQWIYRSRVRDGLPIVVYLPSRRMRHLLLKWLGYADHELF